MQRPVSELTVQDLFDLTRPGLETLTRNEQFQSVLCRLVWQRLVSSPETVIEIGVELQQRLRREQPWRSYLDQWDDLLNDRERLIGLYENYDPKRSGLLSNSPLGGIIDQDDRSEMHRLLIKFRESVAA